MTHGDRIRSMTDEEMADYVATTFGCKACPLQHKCNYRQKASCPTGCETFVLNWLRTRLLSACPFCGHDATIKHITGRYVVKCSICNARIEQPTEELAVNFWNRRDGNAD